MDRVPYIVMALLIVLMISLAFWQLRRLDHRKAVNAAVCERLAQPAAPAPAQDSLGPEWTIITATGEYDASQQLLIDNRSLDGPGFHVVTPLKRADGEAIREPRPDRSRRGPRGMGAGAADRNGQHHGSGTSDPGARIDRAAHAAEGVLTHIARVDVARIANRRRTRSSRASTSNSAPRPRPRHHRRS